MKIPSKSICDLYDVVVNENRTIYVYQKGIERDIESSSGWMSVERFNAPGTYCVSDVKVFDKRKGIATAMYQAAVDSGWRIFKSDDVTAEGEKLWSSFVARGLANEHGEFIGVNPVLLRSDYADLKNQSEKKISEMPKFQSLSVEIERAKRATNLIDNASNHVIHIKP